MGDFINWLLGLFGAAPAPAPDPADPCNAAACVNAKNKVATARGKFNRICTGLKSLKVVADALVEFATREGVTHVIFGQSARSRWDLLLHGSIVDRFLRDVRNATVQIVPVSADASTTAADDMLDG